MHINKYARCMKEEYPEMTMFGFLGGSLVLAEADAVSFLALILHTKFTPSSFFALYV